MKHNNSPPDMAARMQKDIRDKVGNYFDIDIGTTAANKLS